MVGLSQVLNIIVINHLPLESSRPATSMGFLKVNEHISQSRLSDWDTSQPLTLSGSIPAMGVKVVLRTGATVIKSNPLIVSHNLSTGA